MTIIESNAAVAQGVSDPHPALKALDRLVGTWALSGSDGLAGEVAYEWLEGGGFLVQRIDMGHRGERTTGVEYIGLDKESGTLRSHYFAGSGELLEYTYELDGDTLTICHPAPGSPAFFRGTFSADGDANTGRWVWPGGGYESNMARVDGGAASGR